MAIDRKKLVTRHHPTLVQADIRSPFSVGNGEFAFTADITGLQTFLGDYSRVPLCTMSQWGWHSYPVCMEESRLRLTPYDTYGREVGYAVSSEGQKELYDNLRQNSHRLNLGAVGLSMLHGGREAKLEDLSHIEQTLELWQGILHSKFEVLGEAVEVETCVHPEQDIVSARICSKLIWSGELKVIIRFPYGSPMKSASDWHQPGRHRTQILMEDEGRILIKRTLDADVYYVDLGFSRGASVKQVDDHVLVLSNTGKGSELIVTCKFSQESEAVTLPDFYEVRKKTGEFWEDFWTSGGALQLMHSRDPRAYELERRIILSRYLTAIQCSGSVPPAETGLACNSWYGKFHLEMHYWHAAHFTLWGQPEMLEKSMKWYVDILPVAREIASSQGYKGARWPKMCDKSGRNAPSWIAVLLIWQQPHPILYAELLYRANPSRETLLKYKEIVLETADFMVSFAQYDSEKDRYVLGPPLIPVQETHQPEKCLNPAFELEYFRWGMEIANQWLERLGEPRSAAFSEIAGKLSKLPTDGEVYLAHENCPETFVTAPFNHDHPSMLGALGVLPGFLVDRDIMKNTIRKVLETWDFQSLWGWDFPMMAMCCARLGMTSLAIDILMMDAVKNTYLPNGHNPQGDSDDLPLYLPGNGGLLLAAGMMAAGWDDSAHAHAPGFPDDGNWVVESEGLQSYIY